MSTGRLEAFSDGVLAIILTIMVLELKVPSKGDQLEHLLPLWPTFLSYVLSFVYVGIYWNNHRKRVGASRHPENAREYARGRARKGQSSGSPMPSSRTTGSPRRAAV